MIRNQNGVIAVEFIFSLVIAGGLSALLFAVCYSLAIIEVTQYVVYSTARAHAGSNRTSERQREVALKKYEALTTSKTAIGSVYQGTWFEVSKPAALDIRGGPSADGKMFDQDLAGGSVTPNRNWFIGVSSAFNAKVMSFRLPILGSSDPEEDGSFKTRVNTMMIRESSQKECFDFYESRRTALSALPSGQSFYQVKDYVRMEDNGC